MTIDLTWSDEQLEMRRSIIDVARRRLNPDARTRDKASELSREAWRVCAEAGIQGLPIPKEFGGLEADPLTIIYALEGLGYGCEDNGLIFSLNAQMWSCELPLVRFGSEDQKKRYLPELCSGSKIGVQAMTEPTSGSDAFSLRTKAVLDGDDYVLEGSKTFITNAPVADVFVVFAVTDPEQSFAGISTFLIDRHEAGLSIGTPFEKMGLRTSPMSELFLDGCRVPASAMLGSPGMGMAIFNTSMDWERSFILASGVGTMQRILERTIAYTTEREQFAKPISKQQAVSHRIVQMKLRLETSRLLLYRLGWLRTQGRVPPSESALVKLHLSESIVSSALDALQLFGGYGYMTEYGIEQEVRDALASKIYSGTSEIQHNIVADGLGL